MKELVLENLLVYHVLILKLLLQLIRRIVIETRVCTGVLLVLQNLVHLGVDAVRDGVVQCVEALRNMRLDTLGMPGLRAVYHVLLAILIVIVVDSFDILGCNVLVADISDFL